MSAIGSFRERIKSSPLLIGVWVSSIDPMFVEAIAEARFDFIVFDAEHGSLDRGTLSMNLIAVKASGRPSLVRIGGSDPTHFSQALDGGADGVLVPRVKTVEDVERAVELCRYPPVGSRGYGPRRAGGYFRNEASYVANANASIAVMVQIETKEAVRNLDGILAVEGLDGVLVGRNDLAGSLGLVRNHRNPELMKVVAEVLRKARDAGLASAIATGIDVRAISELQALGANVIAAGVDLEYLVRSVDSFLDDAEPYRRPHIDNQRPHIDNQNTPTPDTVQTGAAQT